MSTIKKMHCPVCKAELVVNGKAKLETLLEHVEQLEVSEKDKYQCPNSDCVANIYNVIWAANGEIFTNNSNYSIVKHHMKFIDNNSGPFGSIERALIAQLNIKNKRLEIGFGKKHWTGIVFYRNAFCDENGDVISSKLKHELVINNIVHITNIQMLVHIFKDFYNEKMWTATMTRMRWTFDYAVSERLYSRLFKMYVKIVHRAEYKQYLANKR